MSYKAIAVNKAHKRPGRKAKYTHVVMEDQFPAEDLLTIKSSHRPRVDRLDVSSLSMGITVTPGGSETVRGRRVERQSPPEDVTVTILWVGRATAVKDGVDCGRAPPPFVPPSDPGVSKGVSSLREFVVVVVPVGVRDKAEADSTRTTRDSAAVVAPPLLLLPPAATMEERLGEVKGDGNLVVVRRAKKPSS